MESALTFFYFLDNLPNYETNKRQKNPWKRKDEVTTIAFIRYRLSFRVAFVIVDGQYSKELEETFEAALL